MNKKNYKLETEKIWLIPTKKGYVRDIGISPDIIPEKNRREFGAYLTSVDIFKKFIFPKIKNILYKYTWIDLFGGE